MVSCPTELIHESGDLGMETNEASSTIVIIYFVL